MKKVTIFTDGGCVGNPGPGAWACLLEYGKFRKEIVGGEPATTNNRMEITAAIRSLEALKEPCIVQLFTDSEYLRQGITEWIHSWKKRNWLTSTNQPVKNRDLWVPLDRLASRHRIDWKWLRGHAGHPGNEHCDALAGKEIARIRAAFSPEELRLALRAFQTEQSSTEAQSLAGLGR